MQVAFRVGILFIFMALWPVEAMAQGSKEPPLLNAPRHQRIRIYSTKGGSSYSWFQVDIDCLDKTADVKGDIWGWRPVYSQEKELEIGFREACHNFPAPDAGWSERIGDVAISRTCNSTCMRDQVVSSSANYIIKELYCLQRAKILAEASFYSPSGVKLDSSSRFAACQVGERVVLTLYTLNSSATRVKTSYQLYP
jgi:hypothetical protein